MSNWIFLLSLFVVAVDQATKSYMLQFLAGKPSLPIVPGLFHLTLVKNPGVAFGLFKGYSLPVTLGTLAIIGGMFWSLFRRVEARGKVFTLSFSLILGGAVGNLIDRLRFAGVVDFLDFRIWPVFNVADSCITVGAILMGWQILHYR